MNKKILKLQQRYSQLSDSDLIRIVKVDFKEYENGAVNLAKKELENRNINVDDINTSEVLINDRKNRKLLSLFKSRFSMLNYICISMLFLFWSLFIILMIYSKALYVVSPERIVELIILSVSIIMFYIVISLFISNKYALATSISSIMYSLWVMNRWRFISINLSSLFVFWFLIPILSSVINNLYLSNYKGEKALFCLGCIMSILMGLSISFIGFITMYILYWFIPA